MRPSLIDRARLALRVFNQGLPIRHKNNPIVFPEWRQGQPQWHLVDLDAYIREGFNMNTLIYSAIMYKAKALSSVPLRAYTGDIDNPDILPETHPLAKLCARPNPSQSWREYQMLQEVYLNLTGNAFGLFDRPINSAFPTQLIPLNPLRVYIVPGDEGAIKGYWYVPEGKTMTEGTPMLPEDVSHVKFPNPGDSMDGQGYGLSPLSPLAKSADVDNSITDFLKMFFDSGTMIAGLLKFNMPMTNEQVDRVRARWKEIYGGHQNWDEIGVLDQAGEYQRLGYTFDEMGFETLDERNETRILGPFGVPPILIGSRVGLARSTYSNYDQAYNMFWQDTMLHEAKLFEDDYQYYLSEGNTFPAFDFSDVPAFQQDVPGMVQAWRGLVEYGIPKTMAANIVGLQLGDLIDGDVAYMPLSLVPIGEASATREAQAEARSQPEQAPENSTEDERTGKTKGHWITIERDGENQPIYIDDDNFDYRGSAKYYAKKLGFPPDNIEFFTEKRQFEVGGDKYFLGGYADPKTGRIYLYDRESNSDYGLKKTLAHEITHIQYQEFTSSAGRERYQMIKKYGDDKDFWNMETGQLKEPYSNEFKTYDTWLYINNNQDYIEKMDGIDEYSSSHWRAYHSGSQTYSGAVNETLAAASEYYTFEKPFLPSEKELFWNDLLKKVKKK